MLLITWEGLLLSKRMASIDTFSVQEYNQSLAQVQLCIIIKILNILITLVSKVRSCKDLNNKGSTINGNYTIYPDGETPVEVQ